MAKTRNLHITHDCYAAAMDAYQDSALTDIKSMRPINTEIAIQLAVDAAIAVYIKRYSEPSHH
jgi:hypothetical protein